MPGAWIPPGSGPPWDAVIERYARLPALVLTVLGTGEIQRASLAPADRPGDRGEARRAAGAAPATDAEFLRRVWLDLAGMIPTSAEARAFLDDPSPYKRRAADRPPARRPRVRPADAGRLRRDADGAAARRRTCPRPPGGSSCAQAFAENRPLRRARPPDPRRPTGPTRRPARAAKFFLDREAEPNLLTRDVGRLFLGTDMQCCQCHDHPLIDDYKQAHYYGLFAFLNRTCLFAGRRRHDGRCSREKAEGDVTFTSVFKKKVTHKTGPRVLDGPPVAEPTRRQGAGIPDRPRQGRQGPARPAYSRRAGWPSADLGRRPRRSAATSPTASGR